MPFRETVTRGDLPHWFMPGAAHFITYRLADTLPLDVLEQLRQKRDWELLNTPPESRNAAKVVAYKRFFAEYDRYLDQVCSKDWLIQPGVPEIVVENLFHHHGAKYELLEYTVMPNHVHVLLVPTADAAVADAASVGKLAATNLTADAGSVGHGREFSSEEIEDSKSPLASIMHSLKSYTANQINRALNRTGRLWQKESYDHWVRDDEELRRIAEYIRRNALAAHLVTEPQAWPHCSLFARRENPKCLREWW